MPAQHTVSVPRLTTRLCVALLVAALAGEAFGAGHKVHLGDLMRDTQRMSPKANEPTVVWWIPSAFWEAVLKQDPRMQPSQIDDFVKVLRPYTIIVAVDGKVGPIGGIQYKTEAHIRAAIRVVDKQGNTYAPLAAQKINADARNFLAMMKPILVNTIGPMGKNMHFFLFPAATRKGQRIADPRKEGKFSVNLGARKYKWRLPLGSLLPPKVCPRCRERFSGAYKFCPWCGTGLPAAAR